VIGLVRIILRRKRKKAQPTQTQETVKKPWSFGESIKADVRLKLLNKRLGIVAQMFEPVDLKDLVEALDSKNKKKGKTVNLDELVDRHQSLAAQLYQIDFIAGLGQRMGDKETRISESAQKAWQRMLMMLKIAERKYGTDHPWTQILYEVAINMLKVRLYYSIKSKDTEVEIVEPPPEFFFGGQWWKHRKSSLAD